MSDPEEKPEEKPEDVVVSFDVDDALHVPEDSN